MFSFIVSLVLGSTSAFAIDPQAAVQVSLGRETKNGTVFNVNLHALMRQGLTLSDFYTFRATTSVAVPLGELADFGLVAVAEIENDHVEPLLGAIATLQDVDKVWTLSAVPLVGEDRYSALYGVEAKATPWLTLGARLEQENSVLNGGPAAMFTLPSEMDISIEYLHGRDSILRLTINQSL